METTQKVITHYKKLLHDNLKEQYVLRQQEWRLRQRLNGLNIDKFREERVHA